MENQKQGYFALFRSVLSKDWARDTAKLSLWVRLIGDASRTSREVEFDGIKWQLSTGQLVTQINILARKLRDSKGCEKSAKQVRDMLDFFVSEKMITYSGSRHGTVISIINYSDYQGDFEVTKKVTNEVTNKPSNGAASDGGEVTKLVISKVEQNKNVFKQELKDTPKSPEGSDEVAEKKASSKSKKKSFLEFDRERFKTTWNCKAEKHGLPKINGVSATTEKSLKYLYEAHLRNCTQNGRKPTDMDTLFNGYIEFGYQPTAWAMGNNPDGKVFGIATALRQDKIDEILNSEV